MPYDPVVINKVAHGVLLALFGLACRFCWILLQLPRMVTLQRVQQNLPAFTQVCSTAGTWVIVSFAVLATAYCLWVWSSRSERRGSLVAFLATTTAGLFLVTLPAIIALYLPLVDALHHVAAR